MDVLTPRKAIGRRLATALISMALALLAAAPASAAYKPPAASKAPSKARPTAKPVTVHMPVRLVPAAWVSRLQRDLVRLRFYGGRVDGLYGPLTAAAVRRFQAAARIRVDGIWGRQSQLALTRMLAGRRG